MSDATPPDASFDAGWLALREPVDHRSRAHELIPLLAEVWRARGWVTVVDLGAGTGSNARYLAPRLPGDQRWILVDHDAALLEAARLPREVGRSDRRRGSLAREGLDALAGADLVAGAALLDLVGLAWLERVADACASRASAALFTTIYDGTISWIVPDDTADLLATEARVRAAVNAHQRREKGLGPALGPGAASVAREVFAARGYRTWLAPAPWILDAADAPLARALLDGWASAAREQDARHADAMDRWADARRETVERGRFRLVIGHLDLLALPPGPGS